MQATGPVCAREEICFSLSLSLSLSLFSPAVMFQLSWSLLKFRCLVIDRRLLLMKPAGHLFRIRKH